MNEIQARRAASQLTDPASRAALAAQIDDVIAFLDGVNGGLHVGAPDGQQVSPSTDAQVGTATLALRFFRDSLAADGTYVDLIEESDEPETEPPAYVYLTSEDYHGGLSHAWNGGYQAGLADTREPVPA